MSRRSKTLLLGSAALAAATLVALFLYFRKGPPPRPAAPPPAADTRDGRWRQDLAYLASDLPRLHGNLFWKMKRGDFDAAVASLDAAIPRLDDDEIVVGIARIVAMADDAHTHAWLGKRRLPLVLYWFEDGVFVVAAPPELRSALRCRVLRIGDTDIEEAIRRAATLVPNEGNELWIRRQVPDLLVQSDVLHGLEVVSSAESARFVLRDAAGVDSTVDLEPRREVKDIPWSAALPEPVPAYRRKQRIAYWFDSWGESRALFFQYNMCAEIPGKPFTAFCDGLFAAVDEQRPEKLILDLRFNEGGDSEVIRPFLRGLRSRPEVYRKDRVFVLIGRRTFSSGCALARELHRSGRVTLVGEPTGGSPSSPFRESMQIQLPNSKLGVGLTWRFVGAGEEGSAVDPDIRVRVLSKDYFAGRDPVLEAVLGSTPR
jgi:hypothetical protein